MTSQGYGERGSNGMTRQAIVIGAGPAGLTAAFELLDGTDIVPVVVEAADQVGGLAKTVAYKGNRIDIGGHRFFSKSDRVMRWWLDRMPLEGSEEARRYYARLYPGLPPPAGVDPEQEDRVLLIRRRRSRICFSGKFFSYPVALSSSTLRNLGLTRIVRIGLTYCRRVSFPIRPVQNLEHFLINRFGDELYHTFFQSYTEKVWGVPCREMSPAWGAQRIKEMSVGKALGHWLWTRFRRHTGIAQKGVPTSMICRFLYPKFGPGQMWEETARIIRDRGGQVLLRHRVTGFRLRENKVEAVEAVDEDTGKTTVLSGDYVLSSMPVKGLIEAFGGAAPEEVRRVAGGLAYRDFISVGLLVKRLRYAEDTAEALPPDNWLYVQEPGVRLARIQIYNNWSPYMVRDPERVWLGLEYFCAKGDNLWRRSDQDMLALAVEELGKVGIADGTDVVDGTVLRFEKAYPGYYAAYDRFAAIRQYIDAFENLFLIGRNGMHKYNNQDHSMLTAMAAVDNIVAGVTSKDNIWAVNTEQEYHEEP